MFEMSVQKIIFFIILHNKNLCLSRVVMILASLALGIVHTIDGYDVSWVMSTRIALVNVFMFLCCMFNICDTIFKNFLRTLSTPFLPNVHFLPPLKTTKGNNGKEKVNFTNIIQRHI